MADLTEAPVSISIAVAFGTQLAMSLQTCLEVSWAARETLKEVSSEVSAMAAALGQIQDVLYSSQGNHVPPGLFKEEGLVEVNSLAQKCHLLFKIIIALVQAASGTDDNINKLEDNPDTPSIREQAVDPALGPRALMGALAPKLRTSWLEPRINRCQTELRYLRMTVLLNLQIAKLAKLYNGDLRTPGAFDQGLCLRTTAVKLRERQVKLAKGEQRRQMKEGKVMTWSTSPGADSDSDSEDDSDNDSDDDTPSINGPDSEADAGNCEPTSSVTNPAGETADTMPPSTLEPSPQPVVPPVPPVLPVVPAAALTGQSQTTVSGHASPNAPPYSAHPPVGHHGIECAPAPANLSHAAEKSPLEGPGETQGIHDPKPLIPDIPAEDTIVNPTSQQVSPDSITAAAVLDSAPITALFRPTLSQRIGSWFGRMLGSRAGKKDKVDQLLKDQGSSMLEAYLIGGGRSRQPFKIPLGHEQLKHGLARTLGANNKGKPSSSPWPMLPNLTVFERGMVDSVVKFAYKASPHQRTCVAIQEYKTEGRLPSYLLFFTLTEPLPAVQFKCAIGRKFAFPYELCKEWKDMKELINAAFLHVDIIGPHVMDGHYDLTHDGEIIMPSLWSTTIVPGASITMHMWPMSNTSTPPHNIPAPPGFHGPRPQPVMGYGMQGGVPPPPAPPPHMFTRPTVPNGMPPRRVDLLPMPRPPPPPILYARWRKTKEQKALETEYRDMQVVDFAEEAKLDDVNGVADLIRRFTYIVDAEFTSFDIGIESDDDLYYSDSDASSSII